MWVSVSKQSIMGEERDGIYDKKLSSALVQMEHNASLHFLLDRLNVSVLPHEIKIGLDVRNKGKDWEHWELHAGNVRFPQTRVDRIARVT